MPGDSFALPVRVSCQVNGIRLLGFLFQFVDQFLLGLHRDILRLKIAFNVHTHGALGQVPQVAHTGLDRVLGTQIFSDGLGFGGRLHEYL